jgi:hypothetical protein
LSVRLALSGDRNRGGVKKVVGIKSFTGLSFNGGGQPDEFRSVSSWRVWAAWAAFNYFRC